jgi:hypothetical protein
MRQFRFEKLDDEHFYHIFVHAVGNNKKIMFGGKENCMIAFLKFG